MIKWYADKPPKLDTIPPDPGASLVVELTSWQSENITFYIQKRMVEFDVKL